MNEAFARTLGPEFEPEPQMPFETNTGTQRQEFRVAGTLFKVEVFRLSEDAHDQERFRRRLSRQDPAARVSRPGQQARLLGGRSELVAERGQAGVSAR